MPTPLPPREACGAVGSPSLILGQPQQSCGFGGDTCMDGPRALHGHAAVRRGMRACLHPPCVSTTLSPFLSLYRSELSPLPFCSVGWARGWVSLITGHPHVPKADGATAPGALASGRDRLPTMAGPHGRTHGSKTDWLGVGGTVRGSA